MATALTAAPDRPPTVKTQTLELQKTGSLGGPTAHAGAGGAAAGGTNVTPRRGSHSLSSANHMDVDSVNGAKAAAAQAAKAATTSSSPLQTVHHAAMGVSGHPPGMPGRQALTPTVTQTQSSHTPSALDGVQGSPPSSQRSFRPAPGLSVNGTHSVASASAASASHVLLSTTASSSSAQISPGKGHGHHSSSSGGGGGAAASDGKTSPLHSQPNKLSPHSGSKPGGYLVPHPEEPAHAHGHGLGHAGHPHALGGGSGSASGSSSGAPGPAPAHVNVNVTATSVSPIYNAGPSPHNGNANANAKENDGGSGGTSANTTATGQGSGRRGGGSHNQTTGNAGRASGSGHSGAASAQHANAHTHAAAPAGGAGGAGGGGGPNPAHPPGFGRITKHNYKDYDRKGAFVVFDNGVKDPEPNGFELKITSGVYGMQGARTSMEDKHSVLPHPDFNKTCNLDDAIPRSFFAVYDGHGGYVAAEYSRQHVHKNFSTDSMFGIQTEAALKNALLKTEHDFCSACRKKQLLSSSGTCAVVAYVQGTTLVVANVGDSRSVLSVGQRAVALSVDHKPARPDERERIEALGGRVGRTEDEAFGRDIGGGSGGGGCTCIKSMFSDEKPLRIFPGGLSVSRTIGDIALKATQLIVAEPELTVRQLTPEDNAVILACDGVWDVMNDSQAAELVRKHLDDPAKAARMLSFEAYRRGSKDNISVVVVALHWVKSTPH